MRRAMLCIVLLALVLTGCGGSSTDTSVGDPPKSTPFEKSGSEKVNQIVQQWQTQVHAELLNGQIKQDSIEQKVYQSSATLQEIANFYNGLTTSDKGWTQVKKMPGLQNEQGIFLSGYDLGTTHFVVGAIDASRLGGQGVIIVAAKGNT